MSDYLRRFAQSFAALDKHSLDQLGELYTDDVVFTDPLHEVTGLGNVRRYFDELYGNVSQLRFEFYAFDQVREGKGYLRWTMSFRHPRLNAGHLIHVEGCSHLLWKDKVYQHRDFFDAGAMLYEHVPIMGRAISWLKRRVA
ncbi:MULTISPECIES: nuclear transport factor 2 family protein [unclassified Pseudomonas]|uniref:nuclear transport factor 2 family protein n=1 Tax=unclassified Pseudomonas TaxID=196821 RepID=UPI002AC8AE5B|nr:MULTISPECIES: nuclear transport factor 2 family protein [unclassified Pseudomonas]MEB0041177.1 nuclear transport factor 2 family protein [Pseudomonas sp. MH10]MEB0078257.1 nuclear transport factor 2 family protein [Pseudomonas sp. MH10out]MEB0092217.1 nuclear transport factor 2 family protein [Pseudomonas sp. CCI4.2]MEB0101711.1 nuclear transport factor 2 family protein [Pseudomonas sp. CCI3.2]MEB0122763.1 nuclear transport factor 2 family protein [Pseudomonas sp. CCI1.2]